MLHQFIFSNNFTMQIKGCTLILCKLQFMQMTKDVVNKLPLGPWGFS